MVLWYEYNEGDSAHWECGYVQSDWAYLDLSGAEVILVYWEQVTSKVKMEDFAFIFRYKISDWLLAPA